ncbi:Cof-type HAD-IIB family hydrolase [Flavobacterium sp. RSSA_27]|uniref:Cof-type HAD-IIB family hydrolase n=1 Tax=Flavobacterium sp. RSSA_27 TaxID=3447667 RepID=UPI003F3BF592
MKNIHSNIKVIVSDLDGTLLNSNHQITAATKAIFQQLYQKGYIIIIATGRHHIDAQAIIKEFEIPLYLVTSNGARIHSPNQELLFAYDIKNEIVASVFQLNIDPSITAVLFKENVWLTSKTNTTINSFQRDLSYPPKVVDFGMLSDYSAIKLFFTHESHQVLLDLKDQILETHSDFLCHAFSLPFCLEFMDKSVDKSIAIESILNKEGFTFENAIAFGDGFNDERMLDAVAKGLIMQNAPDALKNKLQHLEVIASNNDNAVANYIKQHILI